MEPNRQKPRRKKGFQASFPHYSRRESRHSLAILDQENRASWDLKTSRDGFGSGNNKKIAADTGKVRAILVHSASQ